MAEYEAPTYNIEVTVPNHMYKFLNEKAKDFSSNGTNISVEKLAELLLKKSYLEFELLTPYKTEKDLSSEVSKLYIYKELLEQEAKENEKDFSIANDSILYDRLLYIGIGAFNSDESNFNLLRKIFDFDYNKEVLLGTISSIKKQDFKEDVPKCLIDFENYVSSGS